MFNALSYRIFSNLWFALGSKATFRFRRAIDRPEDAQQAILTRLLKANRYSKYGRRYRFDQIRSIQEFQRQVPIVTYDDLRSEIEAIKSGESNVLTVEPVLIMEKTTGSMGPTKYIPYTGQLRREFQLALAPWMADLYGKRPKMKDGGAYWAISPAVDDREVTMGGLPIGFETDIDYFCRSSRLCLKSLLPVPSIISRIGDVQANRYVTLRFLLEHRELRFISIWNPSFLTLMIENLPPITERLIEDIRQGSLTSPMPLNPDIHKKLQLLLKPNPSRAKELADLLQRSGYLVPREIWPSLSVISCWASASAKQVLADMERHFSGVEIQPKGLLATEGVVSIPMTGHSGSVLAITSHFLEFIDEEAKAETPLLAHQLKKGKTYEVLITTGGGLYRYALGDRITVSGFLGKTPLVEFFGKSGNITDLCGEKLHEVFVSSVLGNVFARHRLKTRFVLIAPNVERPPHYTIFIETDVPSDEILLVCDDVEIELLGSHHYAYCRRLGQLGPLQVFRIAANGAQDYIRRYSVAGQRMGSIKPAVLSRHGDWSQWFKGKFVDRIALEVG